MSAVLDGKLEYRKPYEIANEAFSVLDAMLVENAEREKDKQEQQNYYDALDSIGIAELMKDHVHDYIYGRVCACGALNGAEKEWQPDWSQAPDEANYWVSDEQNYLWFGLKPTYDKKYGWQSARGDTCYEKAPSFGYQGNWQDSLRKRPQ